MIYHRQRCPILLSGFMSTSDTPERLWAELWLRQDTYGTYEAQHDVLDRMRRLEEAGVLDESTVAGWGKQVLTFEADVRSETLTVLDSFERWAEEAGVSLEPAFDRRVESPMLSSETHEVAVFPVVCFALYEGNDVRAVFPCTTEEGTYTVEDALDTLALDGPEPLLDAVGTTSRGPPVDQGPEGATGEGVGEELPHDPIS